MMYQQTMDKHVRFMFNLNNNLRNMIKIIGFWNHKSFGLLPTLLLPTPNKIQLSS